MERRAILDDDEVALYLYPGIGTVHHVIKRSVENLRFREMMAKAAEAFVAQGCDKYLSDDRAMMTFSYDDLIWAAENWEKPLMAAGGKFWALIPPKKVLGRRRRRDDGRQHAEPRRGAREQRAYLVRARVMREDLLDRLGQPQLDQRGGFVGNHPHRRGRPCNSPRRKPRPHPCRPSFRRPR